LGPNPKLPRCDKHPGISEESMLVDELRPQQPISFSPRIKNHDLYKRTFFHAAFWGHMHIIHGFIKNVGPKSWVLLSSRNETNHNTALHIAAENGKLEVIHALIQAAGPKASELVSMINSAGKTALSLAELNGHIHVALVLEKYQVVLPKKLYRNRQLKNKENVAENGQDDL